MIQYSSKVLNQKVEQDLHFLILKEFSIKFGLLKQITNIIHQLISLILLDLVKILKIKDVFMIVILIINLIIKNHLKSRDKDLL